MLVTIVPSERKITSDPSPVLLICPIARASLPGTRAPRRLSPSQPHRVVLACGRVERPAIWLAMSLDPVTPACRGCGLQGDLRPWPWRPLRPMLNFMTAEGRIARREAQAGKVQAVPEPGWLKAEATPGA